MSSIFDVRPQPDCDRFRRIILGEEIPKQPPFIELFLDQETMEVITEKHLNTKWIPLCEDRELRAKYWNNYINLYYRLGYDFVWIDGRINFPSKPRKTEDTAQLSRATRNWDEEGQGPIASWADYENYEWPSMEHFNTWDMEYVAAHLPEGMGMFSFPCRGFLEIPNEILFGYENLSYLLYDEPELVKAVFERVGNTIMAFYRNIVDMPKLMGFFPGDDMGFNTSTLFSPTMLREHVLPFHKQAAKLAHDHDRLYLLHSCGQLDSIMEELITDIGIDGKHSYEDSILPVTEAKKKYGDRIAVLGGVDIDKIARLPEKELRNYVDSILEVCMPGGRYALGTGNSVANYIPVENYLAMLDQGYHWNR